MPRYMFSISAGDEVRRVGVVQSDDFTGALTALEQQMTPDMGDTLEIGVAGFPPARYTATLNIDGNTLEWRARSQLAA